MSQVTPQRRLLRKQGFYGSVPVSSHSSALATRVVDNPSQDNLPDNEHDQTVGAGTTFDDGARSSASTRQLAREVVSSHEDDLITSDASHVSISNRLWLLAQQRDEVLHDRRWPPFASEFEISEGPPRIDNAIIKFSQLAQVDDGKLRRVFNKAVEFAKDMQSPGNAIVAIDPTKIASAAWGGLQIMVTIASNASKTHDAARHDEAMVDLEECCTLYTNLYLAQSFLPDAWKDKMSDNIVCLYSKHPRHSYKHCDMLTLLERRKWGWTSSNDIERAFQAVKDVESRLEKQLRIGDAHILHEVHSQSQRLYQQLSNVTVPLWEAVERLNKVDKLLLTVRQEELLRWLSPITEGVRLQEILDKHLDGTGLWFLKDVKLLSWQSSSTHETLWLRGGMGTGKSHVIAQAVCQLSEHHFPLTGNDAFAYYLCDRTDVHRAAAMGDENTLLRCLLKQFLKYEKGHRALSSVYHLFNERQLDGRGLSTSETKNIILQITETLSSVSVVLDALDECELSVRAGLLMSLKSIQSQSRCTFRILVASRPAAGIEDSLRSFQNYQITSMKNDQDVDVYIDHRLKLNLERGVFGSDLHPYLTEIREKLAARADGMFRWVASAITLLEQPVWSASRVLERLDSVPQEVENLYQVIYTNISTRDPGSWGNILMVLSIVVCQRMDLPFNTVIEATSAYSGDVHKSFWCQHFFDLLGGFIELDPSTNKLHFAHASIYSFLVNHPDYNNGIADARVAQRCFDFLPSWWADTSAMISLGNFSSYAICNLVWHMSRAAMYSDQLALLRSKILAWKARRIPKSFLEWLENIETLLHSIPTVDSSDSAILPDIGSLTVMVGSLQSESLPALLYKRHYPPSSPGSPIPKRLRTRSRSPRQLESRSSLSSLVSVGSGESEGSHGSRGRCQSPKQDQFHPFAEEPCQLSPSSMYDHLVRSRDRRILPRTMAINTMDVRAGLPSVFAQPSNALFAVAVWDLECLFEQFAWTDASKWCQHNLLGQTPLVVALLRWPNGIAFARMLTECPHSAINARISSRKTALHIACEKDDYDAVAAIIYFGGDVRLRDSRGLTPLYAAISNCNVSITGMLIQSGAGLQHCGEAELNQIWLALAGRIMPDRDDSIPNTQRVLDILQLLCMSEPPFGRFTERGSTFLSDFTVHGFNFLHVAASYENVELAEYVLSAGADAQAQAPCSKGQTALHIAADEGSLATLKLLIKHGSRFSRDYCGRIPLHYAYSADVVHAFIAHADSMETNELLEQRDFWQRTPIMSAMARGATGAAQALLSYPVLVTHAPTLPAISVLNKYRADYDPTADLQHSQEHVIILPYNVSSRMCVALISYHIFPCVSIKAVRPLAHRIAKAGEYHARSFPLGNRSIPSMELQLDPDSEEFIREERIDIERPPYKKDECQTLRKKITIYNTFLQKNIKLQKDQMERGDPETELKCLNDQIIQSKNLILRLERKLSILEV